jgi:hypothetical protein
MQDYADWQGALRPDVFRCSYLGRRVRKQLDDGGWRDGMVASTWVHQGVGRVWRVRFDDGACDAIADNVTWSELSGMLLETYATEQQRQQQHWAQQSDASAAPARPRAQAPTRSLT